MEIYTIGFTRKTAAEFFEPLKQHRIERLVDVRINNTSQLAGFTKRDDLAYFLKELLGADYVHEPMLAPTKELFKVYRDGGMTWAEYESAFLGLMAARQVEGAIPRDLFARRVVLLCSEATPERCHRRLVLEYLDRVWGGVQAIHL
jgi:uncharacterized protein (DUF488 family)